MKLFLKLTAFIAFSQFSLSQTIEGHFKNLPNQKLTLMGFDYAESFELAHSTTDSLGRFSITLKEHYKGMSALKDQQGQQVLIVIEEDVIKMDGISITALDSLIFESPINTKFTVITKGYAIRNSIYRAWDYLDKIYAEHSQLKRQGREQKSIKKAIKRIKREDAEQLTAAPKNSFLAWYIPKRKLLSDIPQSIYNYYDRIPDDIYNFRSTNFKHPYFKTSGLYWELIEAHYFQLENSGGTLDEIYKKMNLSTDILIEQLKDDGSLFSKTVEQLFNLFEKRSLFQASAYLSNKVINSSEPLLVTPHLKKRLHKYVDLKVGNIAPDIDLGNGKKLSDIKKNTLIFFGSKNCTKCQKELSNLKSHYLRLKPKNTEVLYIGLDADKELFEAYTKDFPWLSFCDLKGWETPAVADYHVYKNPFHAIARQRPSNHFTPKICSSCRCLGKT